MIRGLAIGGVVGCMLAILAADMDMQARATYPACGIDPSLLLAARRLTRKVRR